MHELPFFRKEFMQRALQLAELGLGQVSPNPMVGAVVVRHGNIIGEGWHMAYGGPHAEVNAIASVSDHSLLGESTIYVTLEPCSHFGKTPPCADLLIEKGIANVVVANLDPNPLVAGRGLEKLRQAGIRVVTGVMEAEGRWLNRRFFTFMEKQRPYIILKWAQTADGFVARGDFSSKWISNWLSRKLVHRWRGEENAILVGTNTAVYDNPALNVRNWHGKNPLRLLIDRHGKVPPTHQLFDGSAPTIVYGQAPQGIESVGLPNGTEALSALLNDLYRRKVQSLIVEGGTRLLQSFIDQGLWDEARVFESSRQHFGTGIAAPQLHGRLHSREAILQDELRIYQNNP